MTSIPAVTVSPVCDHTGPCVLVLTKKSIEVRTDRDKSLGVWGFEFIRRFHCQEANVFSFTSGRRGPYGVMDYSFKLQETDLKQLQDILSQHTGAKFDSPVKRLNHASSIDSYSSVNPNGNTGYMFMSYNRSTDATSPRGSPSPYSSSTLPNPSLSSSTLPTSSTSPSFRKQSPHDLKHPSVDSPLVDGSITPITGNSDQPSSPAPGLFPKRELKQMKKFDKEPLVNKSPTVHTKRKAEYIDIDLPDTCTSDDNSSIDGSYSSTYDIPTNRLSHYDVPNREAGSLISSQPTYDVPVTSNGNYDVPKSVVQQPTYDIPSTIRPALDLPGTPITHANTLPHSSSASSVSSSSSNTNPTLRPLPHLPTDYVNVSLGGSKTPPPKKPPSGSGYVNIGYHPQKPTIERTEMGMYVDVNLAESLHSKSMGSIYNDIPERIESQLTIRRVESDKTSSTPTLAPIGTINRTSNSASPSPVSKTAKELAEEGYEFINPATLPALMSPPTSATPSVETVLEEDDEDTDNEYITVNRSVLLSPSGTLKHSGEQPGPVLTRGGRPDGEFFQVRSRSKRSSDGYEEIQDVLEELKGSSSGGRTAATLPASLKPLSSQDQTFLTTNVNETVDTKKSPSPPVFSSTSSTPLPLSRQSSTDSDHTDPLLASDSNTTLQGDGISITESTEQQCVNEAATAEPTTSTKVFVEGEVEEYSPNEYCSREGQQQQEDGDDEDEDDFEEVSLSSIESDNQNKSRSMSDPPSPPGKTRAVSFSQGSTLVQTALGSPIDTEHSTLIRKRSSTIGDMLDSKEPKKHTYVNVPDDCTHQVRPTTPKSLNNETTSTKKKPPKPLPRPPSLKNNLPRQSSQPAVVDACVNGNHSNNNNNKVKELVRQFSDF